MKKIENLLINAVDQERGRLLGIPTTLEDKFENRIVNEMYDGFIHYTEEELSVFWIHILW